MAERVSDLKPSSHGGASFRCTKLNLRIKFPTSSPEYYDALGHFFHYNDHYVLPGALPPKLTHWAYTYLQYVAEGKAVRLSDLRICPPHLIRQYNPETDYEGIYRYEPDGKPIIDPPKAERVKLVKEYHADRLRVKQEPGEEAAGQQV